MYSTAQGKKFFNQTTGKINIIQSNKEGGMGNVYLPGTASNGFQKPPRKFVVPIGNSKSGSSHAVDSTGNNRRTSVNNLDAFNFGPHHQS